MDIVDVLYRSNVAKRVTRVIVKRKGTCLTGESEPRARAERCIVAHGRTSSQTLIPDRSVDLGSCSCETVGVYCAKPGVAPAE